MKLPLQIILSLSLPLNIWAADQVKELHFKVLKNSEIVDVDILEPQNFSPALWAPRPLTKLPLPQGFNLDQEVKLLTYTGRPALDTNSKPQTAKLKKEVAFQPYREGVLVYVEKSFDLDNGGKIKFYGLSPRYTGPALARVAANVEELRNKVRDLDEQIAYEEYQNFARLFDIAGFLVVSASENSNLNNVYIVTGKIDSKNKIELRSETIFSYPEFPSLSELTSLAASVYLNQEKPEHYIDQWRDRKTFFKAYTRLNTNDQSQMASAQAKEWQSVWAQANTLRTKSSFNLAANSDGYILKAELSPLDILIQDSTSKKISVDISSHSNQHPSQTDDIKSNFLHRLNFHIGRQTFVVGVYSSFDRELEHPHFTCPNLMEEHRFLVGGPQVNGELRMGRLFGSEVNSETPSSLSEIHSLILRIPSMQFASLKWLLEDIEDIPYDSIRRFRAWTDTMNQPTEFE